MTLAEYAADWLRLVQATRAPRTGRLYRSILARYVLPTFGTRPIEAISRRDVRHFLAAQLAAQTGVPTLRSIVAVLSGLYSAALDDELVTANPASRVGRYRPTARDRDIARKALTRAELATLLAATRHHDPWLYPLLLLLARTGLRPGEACALRWDDLDAEHGLLIVRRTAGTRSGDIGPPKSGRTRRVHVSPQALRGLEAHRAAVNRWLLATGRRSPYVWPTARGFLARTNLGDRFAAVRHAAGLPAHLTPHCLRHTYATLLLTEVGATPQFVQRQMGHSSIQLTVDTYGAWLPVAGRFGDGLDE